MDERWLSTPISDLVNSIISTSYPKSKGNIDAAKIIKELENHLIFTVQHLSRLSDIDVEHLYIPLGILSELKKLVQLYENVRIAEKTLDTTRNELEATVKGWSLGITNKVVPVEVPGAQQPYGTPAKSRRSTLSGALGGNPYLEQLAQNKSAIFGITELERKALLEQWEDVTAIHGEETGIAKIYEVFWAIFPKSYPKVAKLNEFPLLIKTKPISNIMNYMRGAILKPASVIPRLEMLGVLHCILGITEADFKHFAKSWAESLSIVLGEKKSPHLEELWYSIVAKFGEIIVSTYDYLSKQGIRRDIQRKSGLVHPVVLYTHCLKFFKDAKATKPKLDIDIEGIEKCDKCHKEGGATDYRFQLVMKNGKIHRFCVENSQSLDAWIADISLRISSLEKKQLYFGSVQKKT